MRLSTPRKKWGGHTPALLPPPQLPPLNKTSCALQMWISGRFEKHSKKYLYWKCTNLDRSSKAMRPPPPPKKKEETWKEKKKKLPLFMSIGCATARFLFLSCFLVLPFFRPSISPSLSFLYLSLCLWIYLSVLLFISFFPFHGSISLSLYFWISFINSRIHEVDIGQTTSFQLPAISGHCEPIFF